MSTSEKYISEALLRDKPRKALKLAIKDGAVTSPKIADSAVTEDKLADDSVSTDKLVDHNVTWPKLDSDLQKAINLATGIDEELRKDMHEWNNRIAVLELDKLNLKTVITVQDVTEYKEGATIGMTATLQTSEGNVSDDKDFTDSSTALAIDDTAYTVQAAYIYKQYTFQKPCGITVKASGTSYFKGVAATFPTVQKTIYAVLPSYMGYVDQTDTLPDSPSLAGLQKIVKHSLNGSYTLTNGYDSFAYMVVAVPKDGAVNSINRIVQHGLMDAVQKVETKTTEHYTYYICSTAHDKGTYNFIIS